eukprot:Amastigsp_a514143_64.p6 type:complete len:119 gc:universal Amastigsp_a514143_64:462-818(+)
MVGDRPLTSRVEKMDTMPEYTFETDCRGPYVSANRIAAVGMPICRPRTIVSCSHESFEIAYADAGKRYCVSGTRAAVHATPVTGHGTSHSRRSRRSSGRSAAEAPRSPKQNSPLASEW